MSDEFTPDRRRPGRPSNAELAARAEGEPVSKRAAETRRERRRRSDTSQTAGLKLHIPEHLKDPSFEYRWINDDADFDTEGQRVGQRMHAKTVLDDWDQVTVKEGIDGQGEGTPVKRLVGRGEAGRPVYAYLCKKPKDWYRQDKAKELDAVKRREEEMRRGASQGPEGLAGPRAYVPESGIEITRGN
jgi:hypothetical protein